MCWRCLSLIADAISIDAVVESLLERWVERCTKDGIVVPSVLQNAFRAELRKWFGESDQ